MKVEFYNGTTKLGEDLTAPYSFEWVNAPVGTHSLGVKAIDSKNLVGNSALTQITVVVSNSPPMVSLTGPANNSIFLTNSSISLTATASDTDGTVAKVEFFNGSNKLGEDVSSPYSFIWTSVPDGNYTISARATDNKGASAISGSRNVIVNGAANPPTVDITSPAPNETFFANSDVTITASASTLVGTITKVEFFNGNTKLGEDLTSPYSFTWPAVPFGNYSIRARATNSQNATNTSAAVNIILVLITTDPPQVNITSPADGSVFTAGSPITISATASEPNGTIERVEFFAGNTKIGEDPTSPYTFVWNNPPEGTFLVSATATGNSGASATDEIQIFVNAQNDVPSANAGPDISVQLPVSSLIIQGSGTDSDGVISSYEWSQVSGPEEATFEQNTFGELVLGPLVQGVYIFELAVTDNGNAIGKDQVNVNVTPSLLTLEQIPRYFSPNNDGINDLWEWPSVDLYEGAVVMVFNRFGQKVYEATSYQNDWDGTDHGQGKPLQDDAYYYVIKLLNTEIKGAVRIVR
jgi:gliding motility-associated-like protein